MNVAIVAEHVRSMPWHHGRWAVDVARGLRRLGAGVTLLCDAMEDRRQLAPGVALIERAPGRRARQRQPTRFQGWALERLDAGSHDATLSLTRLVPAGLWLPVDPPSLAAFARGVASTSPATVLLESAARPWIVDAIRAEGRARRMASEAHLAGVGPQDGSGSMLTLGPTSILEGPGALGDARARLRRRLDLDDSRPVLLVSLVDRPVASARSLLEAIARSRRSTGPPALIVLTREPTRVHRLASSLGALSRVRILGATSRIDAVISACDAVALPAPAKHGTARLAADAVAKHTPVIAAAGAPGAGLVEPSRFGAPPVGRVLSDVTPSGWQGALDQMLEPAGLEGMRRAAASLAPTLSFGAFIERLASALERGP